MSSSEASTRIMPAFSPSGTFAVGEAGDVTLQRALRIGPGRLLELGGDRVLDEVLRLFREAFPTLQVHRGHDGVQPPSGITRRCVALSHQPAL